ncbi:MAG: 1-(5-phosphoribosyl)-5-[(5-phosphoribosylamino)methylideneamino]imidazole-4-carboxamide isomerase [Acidimicrobiia bacterium]
MELFPAIDLLGGRCVRLMRGEFEAVTDYSGDPLEVALSMEAAGARYLHVVDLDAARTGEATNLSVIAKLAGVWRGFLQSGGGVRTTAAAASLLDVGVDRVVLGTAAVEQPILVEALAQRYPNQVAVGLDARGGRIAVRGWQSESPLTVVDLARRFEGCGISALVVTQIERDGTMEGPDLATLVEVLEATETDVVASGGVGSLSDLDALARLAASASDPTGRALAAAIVGRAIYEGRFTVEEALACLRSG